jgi:hypothetical protein
VDVQLMLAWDAFGENTRFEFIAGKKKKKAPGLPEGVSNGEPLSRFRYRLVRLSNLILKRSPPNYTTPAPVLEAGRRGTKRLPAVRSW